MNYNLRIEMNYNLRIEMNYNLRIEMNYNLRIERNYNLRIEMNYCSKYLLRNNLVVSVQVYQLIQLNSTDSKCHTGTQASNNHYSFSRKKYFHLLTQAIE